MEFILKLEEHERNHQVQMKQLNPNFKQTFIGLAILYM
jgi:hypothetical protein